MFNFEFHLIFFRVSLYICAQQHLHNENWNCMGCHVNFSVATSVGGYELHVFEL